MKYMKILIYIQIQILQRQREKKGLLYNQILQRLTLMTILDLQLQYHFLLIAKNIIQQVGQMNNN